MGLKKDIELPNKSILSYHRIERIYVGEDGVTCEATIGSYVDQKHRECEFTATAVTKYKFKKKSDNLINDAYEHIKSLKEWKGSAKV